MTEALFTLRDGSCIIHDPKPPRHWYNHLWNSRGYCAKVSQTGHGPSWCISEHADMCRLNSDEARYLYLRDEASGKAWCVGGAPLRQAVEDYACEHSLAYSRITSRLEGIRASWRIFVPETGTHEVWTVTVCNESEESRAISLFSAVSFELEGFTYPRYYEMYRCLETCFDPALNGVYCASAHPFAPHERYNAFIASSEPVVHYDGNLAAFCGTNSTVTQPDASARALFQCPEIVVSGRDCTDSDAALFITGGVLQHRLALSPGETRTLQIVAGVCESMEEARTIRAACSDPAAVEEALAFVQRSLENRYGQLSVHTPDEKINLLMNRWVQKQIDCCIVGKKGVRDNLQIAVAMLSFRPEKAREEILECLAHQFQDGHAVLTWYPYDDTRYSDQPFWIIWAVCELIKETGDFSLLHRLIPLAGRRRGYGAGTSESGRPLPNGEQRPAWPSKAFLRRLERRAERHDRSRGRIRDAGAPDLQGAAGDGPLDGAGRRRCLCGRPASGNACTEKGHQHRGVGWRMVHAGAEP